MKKERRDKMIDKSILTSSFKIQSNCVSQFGVEYIRTSLIIKNQKLLENIIQEENSPYTAAEIKADLDLDYCRNYVSFINSVFENMTAEFKEIIYNDYFTVENKNWWAKKYSKSTLYRLKKQALKEFLIYVI